MVLNKSHLKESNHELKMFFFFVLMNCFYRTIKGYTHKIKGKEILGTPTFLPFTKSKLDQVHKDTSPLLCLTEMIQTPLQKFSSFFTCSVFPAFKKIANPATFILLSFYRALRGLPRGLDIKAAWCMTSCGRVVWSYLSWQSN